jgi:hypothetical protein
LWTSSCGELSLALCSDAFLRQFSHLLQPSSTGALVRTLQIFVGTIAEKLGGRDQSTQKKLQAVIFSGDIETDWRQIYPYLATTVELLSIANLKSESPSLDVFWIIASFILATAKDLGSLFPTLVDGLPAHAKSNIDIHPTIPVPRSFPGFLPAFVKLETDLKYCPDYLPKVCWLFTTLSFCGSPHFLLPSAPPGHAVAAVILLLVPYFATVCDEPLFSAFADSLGLDIRPIWDYFRGVSEIPFPDVIGPIIDTFESEPNSEFINYVLRAFALFVRTSSDFGPPVYAICTVLLQRGIATGACASLARVAQHDRATRNVRTACEFLEACRAFPASQAVAAAVMGQLKFPVTELPSAFTPKEWKPTEGTNVCQSDAPPFYPTDPTLTLLPYAKEIRAASMAVRIAPFTDWATLMFAMETTATSVEPQELPEIDEAKLKQFKAKIRQIEQGIAQTSSSFHLRHQSPSSAGPELVAETVDDAFLTDQAEIDAAGRDLPGADFPTVFPL